MKLTKAEIAYVRERFQSPIQNERAKKVYETLVENHCCWYPTEPDGSKAPCFCGHHEHAWYCVKLREIGKNLELISAVESLLPQRGA